MVKYLRLFENFTNSYKWPEAKFWLDKLEPEEICFLGLYSLDSKKEKLFEAEYEGPDDEEPNEKGSGSFEMFFQFPIAKGQGYSTLSCEIRFSGDFTPYDSGDYYTPPEGGEYILENIETESAYYLDESEDKEFEMLETEYKSGFIKKADLVNMIEYFALNNISYSEDETDVKKPEIPQGLLEKCENIRNQDPGFLRAHNMLNRFGI
jgi:hypothetical protein